MTTTTTTTPSRSMPPRSRPTLALVALACAPLLLGCDVPPAAGPVAPPAEASSPTEAPGPSASAAPGLPARKLSPALVADVELGFEHHAILDRTQDVGQATQRTVLLEVIGPTYAEATSSLEGALERAGFTRTSSEDQGATLNRGYARGGGLSEPGGVVVTLSADPYEAGNAGMTGRGTGTLSLTVKTKK